MGKRLSASQHGETVGLDDERLAIVLAMTSTSVPGIAVLKLRTTLTMAASTLWRGRSITTETLEFSSMRFTIIPIPLFLDFA